MPRELKVYGWQSFRRQATGHHGQTREICAAPSKAAVARAAGVKYPNQLFNLTDTGNKEELEVALAEPGVVFWRSMNDYHGTFQRA